MKRTEAHSFLDFLRNIKDNGVPPIGLYNRTGLSQCNPQIRWTENVALDFIGRVESLSEDVQHVLKEIGLPRTDVPTENATHHHPFMDCYCTEARQIVEDLYREDFEAFGYPYYEV